MRLQQALSHAQALIQPLLTVLRLTVSPIQSRILTLIEWSDGTTAPKTYSWRINKAVFPIPAQVGTAYYNDGYAVTPTWNFSSYSNSHLVQITNGTGTTVGNYTATFHLPDIVNCMWSDGSTDDKTAQFYISKRRVTVPSQRGTLIYDPNWNQSPDWYDYNTNLMTLGDTTSGKDARTYNATFTLKDSANNCWNDGTTSASHTAPWVIEKRGVDRPSFETWYFSNTKTRDYNGQFTNITDEIYGFDNFLMSIHNSYSDIMYPGNYAVSISLNRNCYWNGVGNSDSIRYTYTIKALDLPNDINQVLRIAGGSASFPFSMEYTVKVNESIEDLFYIDDSSRPYSVNKVTGISHSATDKISTTPLSGNNYSAWMKIETSLILNRIVYFDLKVEVIGYNAKTYSNCLIIKITPDHS